MTVAAINITTNEITTANIAIFVLSDSKAPSATTFLLSLAGKSITNCVTLSGIKKVS